MYFPQSMKEEMGSTANEYILPCIVLDFLSNTGYQNKTIPQNTGMARIHADLCPWWENANLFAPDEFCAGMCRTGGFWVLGTKESALTYGLHLCLFLDSSETCNCT